MKLIDNTCKLIQKKHERPDNPINNAMQHAVNPCASCCRGTNASKRLPKSSEPRVGRHLLQNARGKNGWLLNGIIIENIEKHSSPKTVLINADIGNNTEKPCSPKNVAGGVQTITEPKLRRIGRDSIPTDAPGITSIWKRNGPKP